VAVPSGLLHLDTGSMLAAAAAAGEGGSLAAVQARCAHLAEAEAAPSGAGSGLAGVQATAGGAAQGGGQRVTLPFGVTLLAGGWRDEWLWGIAAAMHRESGLGCGPAGHLAAKAATAAVGVPNSA
jgi:hypothetical protein